MKRPYVSPGHVIWAWEAHIRDWSEEGLSAAQIRTKLREQHSLNVGVESVKAVLESWGISAVSPAVPKEQP